MAGAAEAVNKDMKESQAVAGFEYADFEASIAKFDSSFQVLFYLCCGLPTHIGRSRGPNNSSQFVVAACWHAALLSYTACIGRGVH